jgi:DNA processing protein
MDHTVFSALSTYTITKQSRRYPDVLRTQAYAPAEWYCWGNPVLLNAPRRKRIAVIGTRQATEEGMRQAYRTARLFAEWGATIVHGLALGIDTAAAQGCVDSTGSTIAVLNNPPQTYDDIYPPENRGLAAKIIDAGGTLVTAYQQRVYERELLIRRMIERDAHQAMLSDAIIAVQGDRNSGTRHAINWALVHNIPVFVPQPDHDDHREHPNSYRLVDDLVNSGRAQMITPNQYKSILAL